MPRYKRSIDVETRCDAGDDSSDGFETVQTSGTRYFAIRTIHIKTRCDAC